LQNDAVASTCQFATQQGPLPQNLKAQLLLKILKGMGQRPWSLWLWQYAVGTPSCAPISA
jgi:hypothetical protein